MEVPHEKIDRYCKIFRYAPGLIVVSSTLKEGRLIEVNEAFEKTFKCRQTEIVGLSPVEFSFWANPQDHTWVVNTLRENIEMHDREFYFRDTTGNVFPGLYAGTIVEIAGEDCLLSVIMDITDRKRAEEECVRLAAIVESSDDAIIGTTPDGIITNWNRAAEKIYGYFAGEIIGRPISVLMPPDRHDEMSRISERLKNREHVRHFETALLARDGREIDVSLSISPINDASGTLIGISTIARDITDRRRTIDALRESEEHFRFMADSAPVLIWVAGPDSGCTFFNQSWLEFTGRSMKQELGNGWTEGVHPDDLGRCIATYMSAFNSRCSFSMEYRLRRASGEYAWIADKGVPRYAPNGEFAGYIGSGFDITERKLKEQELKESEDTLKMLMDLMPVGVGWYDSNGTVEYVNSSFVDLFGFTHEDTPNLGAWFSKAYPDPVYRQEMITLWNDIISKSQGSGMPIEPLEAKVTCKDGSVRQVIISAQLVRNRTLVSFTDVTERDANQDRLLNSQRLESLGVLAGGIAHDFNNILTGIMGNISLARMFLDTPEKSNQLLDHAELASRRAAELVRQLLTFARGGAPIKKKLSVRNIVKESVSLALYGTNVKAVLDIPDSLHDIEADAGQLRQVFNNIVVNAVQAMPGGGTMTVRAGKATLAKRNKFALPAGEYLTLLFEDQGSGIPERDKKRIFDPYFTTKPKASGIGLSTAHSIVKKHGGHIDVQSTVGKGTKITLYLPSIGFAVIEQRGGKEGVIAGTHGGGAILVMDDESIVREIAAEMLNKLGYQVTTCNTGEEAVDLYRTAKEAGNPFVAAIMDLTIPGGTGGKEAAKQILQIDPSACLIVSSGYSNDPIMAEYARYGFKAALSKPYIFNELERVLSSIDKATAGPGRHPSPDH